MKKIIFGERKNIICENLKLERIKNSLTQQQLAEQMQLLGVNMDQQVISKIEKNQRIVTDYELACFCRVLKVSLDDMIEFSL